MFRRWMHDAVAAGAARAERDGALDGVGRAGRRRRGSCCSRALDDARLRVLHQLRVPQGRATSTQPPRARCCSRGTRSSGRCGSRATATRLSARGERRVLRQPPARLAARGVGVAAVGGGPGPGRRSTARYEEAASGSARATCRGRRALGRLPRRAGAGRVLAGPARPDARPAALPAYADGLGGGAARALTPPAGLRRSAGKADDPQALGPPARGAGPLSGRTVRSAYGSGDCLELPAAHVRRLVVSWPVRC